MALGKPAIVTPRELELRSVQQAIDQTRERFSGIDAALLAVQKLVDGSKASEDIKKLQQQVSGLTKAIAALNTSESITVVQALLEQQNGLVVLKDGALITRRLQAGEGIVILYPDGALSDPLIKMAVGPVDVLPLAGAGSDGWLWADDALSEVIE